jgi:type IV secretory pathway VirJ component
MKLLKFTFTIIVILLISRPVFAEVVSGKRASTSEVTPETLKYEHFGTVAIYRNAPHPAHVVLFVSGDGGWDKAMPVMAKELMDRNTLVVGIDIKNYMPYLRAAHGRCTFPAGDLEE